MVVLPRVDVGVVGSRLDCRSRLVVAHVPGDLLEVRIRRALDRGWRLSVVARNSLSSLGLGMAVVDLVVLRMSRRYHAIEDSTAEALYETAEDVLRVPLGVI